ncbi:hypothetical protein AAFN88_14855 [Pelagibius sp. CAU 1746]|uniref:hypothetical protein n=1 Tax=Pelagibius sp. CAU 1746 TaxID=3140370 RepID=UPI00325BC39C
MNAGICAGRLRLFSRACPAALAMAACAWLAGPSSALSAEVTEAEFLVSVSDGEGNLRSVQADIVPYLPDRACFGWRLRLAGAPALVRYREVLKLPSAPDFWTGENDSYSPHRYSADRTTATTEEFAAPDKDGWISSRWCIAEGDPVGPHSIDVYVGDSHARHFAFEVKKLSD